MSNATKSILLAGVGGQGILRASDILCLAFMATGLDVKKSEVHGMAQRGGCVTSHVRYGAKVYSPIAKKGDVDILLSFEKLETLRYLDYLKADGVVIINEEEIYPPSVNLGDAIYPGNIEVLTSRYFKKVKCVNAPDIARRAGNVRAINTALLGALSNELTITDDVWNRVLKESFPQKALEANLQAFNLGKLF
ncbi:MAG: indolepyruvate oxidoreductase subunit beta [Deltaproteobacteria bacterium HGW-Deltaproteobacteria-11]|nr:MAG: indolepyruvate oxidoreductase subunit beta [Deltaproteobacteria bacterium HGW-Deltaproteobacteria-11]